MIAYKCDRCGRVLNPSDREKPLVLVINTEEDTSVVDLCSNCYDQLSRWYRRTARQKVKPIEIPEVIDGFIFK